MSYEHLLIPRDPSYLPSGATVAHFAQCVIDEGYLPTNPTVSFLKVICGPAQIREMRDPTTGVLASFPLPSRRRQRAEWLEDPAAIAARADAESEYDVAIAGEGVPRRPPCVVGLVENEFWKPFDGPYSLDLRFHVRSRVVRTHFLDSEEDLHRPLDLASFRPRVDEDCTPEVKDGIFVHPEAGAIRITHAGCATFWMGLKYGKLLFPRLKDGTANVCDPTLVELATRTFGVGFVQACNWG
jgi:hypothetical protein